MSAPIVTCGIAAAIGALLPQLNKSLGCKASVEHFPGNGDFDQFFLIYLHDHDKAFSGQGDALERALMDANESRQAYEEMIAGAAPC